MGAKNSGKSHTFFGTLSDPGVLLLFAHELFAAKRTNDSEISISISIMKFDDDFHDLLCPSIQPLIFRHTRQGLFMPACTRVHIKTIR